MLLCNLFLKIGFYSRKERKRELKCTQKNLFSLKNISLFYDKTKKSPKAFDLGSKTVEN